MRRAYRSITVMTGATSTPALAAAATSDPTLQGKFVVFHCFCSALPGDGLGCRIGRFFGDGRVRVGLVSSIGGELATGSWTPLPPASRVIRTAMGPYTLLTKQLLGVLARREHVKL